MIMVAWMDGTHKSVFVDACKKKENCTDIQWPSSLTIDHTEQKLYWCDPRLETIERIGLDGKNREIIVKHRRNNKYYPFSMAFHDQVIYFTDLLSTNISKVSLKVGANREYVSIYCTLKSTLNDKKSHTNFSR